MASKKLSHQFHPSRLLATVSGNLATGKTFLCQNLKSKFKEEIQLKESRIVFEEYEANEHLPNFYKHLKDEGFVYNPHSFRTQLSFIEHRSNQLDEAFNDKKLSPIIEDRSLFEFSEVFASCQAARGLMNKHEFDQYKEQLSRKRLILPDILFFLQGNKKSIEIRNREIEKDLAEEYLYHLDNFLENYVNLMSLRGTEIIIPSSKWMKEGYLSVEGSEKVLEIIKDRDQKKRKHDDTNLQPASCIPTIVPSH